MKNLIINIVKIIFYSFAILNNQLFSIENFSDGKSKPVTINFDNIQMVEYVRYISKITNQNFIFDESDLNFTVTIVSEEPTSIDNVMTTLLQELRIHNLVLMEQGNQLIIHKNPQVNSPSKIITPTTEEEGCSSQIITQVFRLNTLDPGRAGNVIRPLISSHAIMEFIEETNHLIVTDLRCNVIEIAKLLKHLDSPSSGLVVGQYVSAGTDLEKLQILAQQIVAPLSKNSPLVLVPNRNSNSLFIVSTPFLVERSIAILQYLDMKPNKTGILDLDPLAFPLANDPALKISENEEFINTNDRLYKPGHSNEIAHSSPRSKFCLHKLQYRRGDAITSQIKQVAASLQQGKEHEDFVATINTVEWLKESKSLVFSGTPENLEKVRSLIQELDFPLRQVYIEMLIINTSVDDSLNYSVNWAAQFQGKDFIGAEGFTTGTQLNNFLNNTTPDPSKLVNSAGFNLGIIGKKIIHKALGIEFGSIGALLNALHQNNIANIVLSPKIVTEDNVPAQIFVGVNTPFKTQSIVNDSGEIITSNFEFRDVGTNLQVTPHLHNSDMITLEILQERSDLITMPASNANSRNVIGPSSRKNSTKTTVHVPSGYFVIISGLIETDTRKIRKQVPCLGSVPLIGAAFSDKDTTDSKKNLMIFIRPLIIDTDDEFQRLTQHQQDVLKAKNQPPKQWVQEVDEALDFLNLKKTTKY